MLVCRSYDMFNMDVNALATSLLHFCTMEFEKSLVWQPQHTNKCWQHFDVLLLQYWSLLFLITTIITTTSS
jgi:hypothetical protein